MDELLKRALTEISETTVFLIEVATLIQMLIQIIPQILDQLGLHCSTKDIRNLSRTCHACHILLAPLVTRTIVLPSATTIHRVEDEHLERLEQHTRSLTISGGNLTTRATRNICKMKELNKLNLNWTDLDDSELEKICKSLHKLKHLDIGRTTVSDAGIAYIKDLKMLESLVLRDCSITDSGFAIITQRLRSLRKLDLSGYLLISNDALSDISELTRLEELVLQQWTQLSDTGLLHIARIQQLRYLDITGCTNVSSKGLACLSEAKNLHSLIICYCRQISDKGCCSSLGRLGGLNVLDVTGCCVSDEFFYNLIGQLPHVEIRNVYPC